MAYVNAAQHVENHRLMISVILIVLMFVFSLFNFCFMLYAHRIRILGHIVIWMTDCGEALHYSHFKLQAAFVQSRERFIDWKLYDKSSLFIVWKRLKKQLLILLNCDGTLST